MAGAVVEEQSSDYSVLIDAIAAGGFITTGVMDNQAASAFAEAEYSFGADRVWSVAAGARFIREEKEVRDAETTVYVDGGPATGGTALEPFDVLGSQREWTEPVVSATLARRLGESANVYARFAQGFRSGSYSHTNPSANPVDPEFNDAYTLGIKSEWLDGRLRANAEAFYYDITDLQVQAFDALEGALTRNGGTGESLGVDGQIAFLSESRQLSVMLDATYLNTEYTDFPDAVVFIPCADLGIEAPPLNCVPGDPTSPAADVPAPDLSGNDMLRAPEWTGSLTVRYELATPIGPLALGSVVRYTDNYYFDPNNRLEQDATTIVNLTATIHSAAVEGVSLTLWANNATDEEYFNTKEPIQFGDFAHWANPRTLGVTLSYSLSE